MQPVHFPLSISAIVIDLDGTLLHTAPELTEAANRMLRDAHYIDVREALRRVAAQENVIAIRFFEAMQIINKVESGTVALVSDEIEHNEAGYNCLAQYVARAITLGVFAKNMRRRPAP